MPTPNQAAAPAADASVPAAAPAPGACVPAYGDNGLPARVVYEHSAVAVLVDYDMLEQKPLLDAAVFSLQRFNVNWTRHPTFPSPFVSGTTATMHRNMLLMSPAPLLALTDIYYEFSGLRMPAQACTPEVQVLMDFVNANFAHGDAPFDRVLVNEYENGADTISQHSDKGTVGDIVGIAVGARRYFRLSHTVGGRSVTLVDVVSHPYHALVMEREGFQRQLKHGVPKKLLRASDFADGRIPEGSDGPRVSFTFRRHVKPEQRGGKRARASSK